ncbi:MAG: T9SS type A sorting domain-containing protein [Bacteroidales bacterium]|nr:T9SS type A sorting domain-containing protein [Bacteroidales bacterium]
MSPGLYKLKIHPVFKSGENSVEFEDSIELVVKNISGIEINSIQENINVFYNQTTQSVTLILYKEGTYHIVITDVNGRVMFRKNLKNSSIREQILNLSDFPHGMYILNIFEKESSGQYSLKIIK